MENFSILLETIHFAPKSVTDIKQLLFEYRELFKFACETAGECRDNFYINHFVQNMLKQFVNKYGSKFPILYSFLSYVVSSPTFEAVVERWGSSIDLMQRKLLDWMALAQLIKWHSFDLMAHLQAFSRTEDCLNLLCN